MEFIEELKHAWGVKRKDNEAIKQIVLESYKDKNYKRVIELCSKLDYKKEPLDAELGYALCYSIWAEPGNDSEAMGIAQKCVEYYDEARFKEICSYAQEYWAGQSLKNANNITSVLDFKKEVEENVIKVYKNALSWNHNNDTLKKRIQKSIYEAYGAVGEKYYDHSFTYSDNWKEREERKDYLTWAIPYFEKANNNEKVNSLKSTISRIKEQMVEDNKKFGKPLKDFPETSSFCNKLIKAGYLTLGDFLKASLEELDEIPKIGEKTMKEIQEFRNKF